MPRPDFTPAVQADLSDALRDFIDEAPLERRSIVNFIASAAHATPNGARVLDVGAGAAPYRELFAHCEYVTADWAQSEHAGAEDLDIIAPGDDLPVGDASFDAVVCTQVLEHVPRPGSVLKEFARVLRDDAPLYLSVPFIWEEHEAPHDYYRYSRSGLTFLLEEAGFEHIEIRARTDAFTTLAQLTSSAKWSIGEAPDEDQPARQAVFDRLNEISRELASLSEFDGRWVFPLGYTVTARRRVRTTRDPVRRSVNAQPSPTGPVPVLYLAPWVDLGGSDKGTIDLFKHLDHEGWAPSLITTQPSPNRWVPALAPFAAEVWDLPQVMAGEDFAAFILDFIVSRGVRVVHIMNSRLAFDLLPDISALEDPPVVVVQLHAEEPDKSGYVRYTSTRYANLIDAFSVTSEQLGEAVRGYGVPASKVHVITTGVDGVHEFAPERVEPFGELVGATPRILWPGRLVQQKDPHLTLDVLRILVDRDVDFVLDVVGDGEMEQELRLRAAEIGVADRINWNPPSQEMPRWYRTADLLLMTSVFEGVPYVMYEALAMEVPVIVPAIPGNVEFIPDESAGGILIDPRDDASAYADAIERLLRNPTEREELGRCGRRRLLADFTLEQMARRHESLYGTLLQARPARPKPSAPGVLDVVELPRDPVPERSVAVIVPCYRHGQYVEDAIASIKAQTLKAAEIVVVDDGSTDQETFDALARIDRDPAVRVLRLARNSGPSVARNRALAEVSSNYVLPLDADDLLLPEALERMVEQLEQAPPDVGFVYPNAQHFGNRHDYYEVPAYNLYMLMQGNFCPATTLFDRRVFDAGLRYPESLIHGHEDWDLVLQLASHGVHGIPADGPTFLYRKVGFSRITAMEYAEAEEEVHERHPELYARAERIKAAWAPALSLVLVDPIARDELESTVARLSLQGCGDFELLALGDTHGVSAEAFSVRGVGIEASHPEPHARAVAEAVRVARGRFVVLLSREALEVFDNVFAVEMLVRVFWHNPSLQHYALAKPQAAAPRFAQLDAASLGSARPLAVAWRREEGVAMSPIDIGDGTDVLGDVVTHWEMASGPIQWRSI